MTKTIKGVTSEHQPDSPRRHRERRFHRPRQALGVDYVHYDVVASPAPQLPFVPPSPKPEPAIEPHIEETNLLTLSDENILQELARRGMQICLSLLLIALVCYHLRTIVAILRAVFWGGLSFR
jgi:hypothetical protein